MDTSLYNLDDSLNVVLLEPKHVAVLMQLGIIFYSRIVKFHIIKVLLPTDA